MIEFPEKVSKDIGSCFKEIVSEAIDDWLRRVEPIVEIATDRGWFIFDPFMVSFVFLASGKFLLSESEVDPQAVVNLLERVARLKYVNDFNIEQMRETWNQNAWSKERWPVFMEAIECYKTGWYFASVSTSVPLVEGVLTRGNGLQDATHGQLKDFARKLDETGNLGKIVDRFFARYKDVKTLSERLLNRNVVAHSFEVDFGTKVRALQAISLVNTLVWAYNGS